MKQETNNEMDLLLRRLGRRPETFVSDGNGDVDHLDADELSAYAENVLPAAARSRYTAHLAECAGCRELVVTLSSSAGVVPMAETAVTHEPSTLRKFLASFFSPMVLRYAVPALGLIVVAAIGFFVLKQKQNESPSITQKVETPSAEGIATTYRPESAEPKTGSVNLQDAERPAKPAQSNAPTEPQPVASAPEAPPPAATGSFATKEEQQPVTAEAPAPAPKTEAIITDSQRQIEDERREAPRVQATPIQPQSGVGVGTAKVEDRKTTEVAKKRADSKANKGEGFGVVSGLAAESSRGKRDDSVEKDKNDAGPTTTVAGRHFRKQGGVWIDTAYNSSRGVTSVTRGSEQYRALIADEPPIKTIADTLDGEVIVVWKSRAYRIR